ncbi:Conserved membrane spanning protein (fragment) [metagenome]|uniref:Conserved membrane spanning protein n=1 Tax=metagenome TaxID=256318 RepID=A0A2P2C6W2_9ZZZZ
MRSLRFLLSRRWILFVITVVLLTALAWRLGLWQFHRLEDRKASNAIVENNVSAEPVPVAEVLEVGAPVRASAEWKRVTASGVYDAEDTIVVRYQTREGEPGVDVVVPLRTVEGAVLLVDRGWMPASNRGADVGDVPAPPTGQVDVTGWVRSDATGSSTRVSDQSVRSISSAAIADALDLEVYGGFVDLDTESPAPAQTLEKAELPDLGNGPHFFYGLQWWFFGLLAVFGFFYLLYDEWRGPDRTTGRTRRWLQGPEHAAVDGQHDTVDKA